MSFYSKYDEQEYLDRYFNPKPAPVEVGDTVTAAISGKITRIETSYGQRVAYLDNGTTLDLNGVEKKKINLTVTKKKVVHPRVNEILSAARVREVQWKTGTVIRGTLSKETLTLRKDGKWANSFYIGDGTTRFSELYGDWKLIFDASVAS